MIKKLSVLFAFFIIPAGTLFSQSITGDPLILPAKSCVIPFNWKGDSINSKWELHAAMLIPIRLKNCPRTFYMQFDLGSPYSLLYKNKTDAIQTKYPGSIPEAVHEGKIENFLFKAGKTPVAAKQIVLKQFDSTSIDWNKKNQVEIIGTIGADLIDGKVAIIDYPACRLSIADSIPPELAQQISMSDFMYTHGRVLLPAKIKGKKTILYFDTGSSMFELLTSKETCNQLAAPGAELKQYKVASWGKLLTANTLASNESMELANTIIPIRSSSYIEGVSNAQVEQMLKMGIGGMTGNKIFLGHILILDTKNKKFGLKAFKQ